MKECHLTEQNDNDWSFYGKFLFSEMTRNEVNKHFSYVY